MSFAYLVAIALLVVLLVVGLRSWVVALDASKPAPTPARKRMHQFRPTPAPAITGPTTLATLRRLRFELRDGAGYVSNWGLTIDADFQLPEQYRLPFVWYTVHVVDVRKLEWALIERELFAAADDSGSRIATQRFEAATPIRTALDAHGLFRIHGVLRVLSREHPVQPGLAITVSVGQTSAACRLIDGFIVPLPPIHTVATVPPLDSITLSRPVQPLQPLRPQDARRIPLAAVSRQCDPPPRAS